MLPVLSPALFSLTVSAFRLAADDHLISRTFPPVLHHDYPQSVRKPAAALICPSADLHKRTPGSLRSRGFCKFVASAFETSVSGRPGCRGEGMPPGSGLNKRTGLWVR